MQAYTESVALIGDVHGDIHWFDAALRAAGADPDAGTIIPGRWIIQLGDLVHVGPESGACISRAERMLQHPRYRQLLGNHDAAHLGGPWRSAALRARHDGAPWGKRLRALWHDGQLQVAVAIRGHHTDTLASHAGLTAHLWQQMGCPDATAAARMLNWRRGAPAPVLAAATHEFAGGLLTGRVATPAAGPLHAAACAELIASWRAATSVPAFDQVHGHAAPWHFGRKRWESDADPQLRRHLIRDTRTRRCTWTERGRMIVALDPHRTPPPLPLIIPGRPA